jgi:hypothetical protein
VILSLRFDQNKNGPKKTLQAARASDEQTPLQLAILEGSQASVDLSWPFCITWRGVTMFSCSQSILRYQKVGLTLNYLAFLFGALYFLPWRYQVHN